MKTYIFSAAIEYEVLGVQLAPTTCGSERCGGLWTSTLSVRKLLQPKEVVGGSLLRKAEGTARTFCQMSTWGFHVLFFKSLDRDRGWMRQHLLVTTLHFSFCCRSMEEMNVIDETVTRRSCAPDTMYDYSTFAKGIPLRRLCVQVYTTLKLPCAMCATSQMDIRSPTTHGICAPNGFVGNARLSNSCSSHRLCV